MNRPDLNSAIDSASEILAADGFECIEAEWVEKERILRLYIELTNGVKPHSNAKDGINLDQCVIATRRLLDAEPFDELIEGPYRLEVSSPGVERPLRLRADFERHVGLEVEVKLSEPAAEQLLKDSHVPVEERSIAQLNRKHGKGQLLKVEDAPSEYGDAVIAIKTNRGIWTFPLGKVQKANLVFDWNQSS